MNIYKYKLDNGYRDYYVVAKSFGDAEDLILQKYTSSEITSLEKINDGKVLIQNIEVKNEK